METFTDQVPAEIEFCGYRLLVPSRHPIMVRHTPGRPQFQPYRETGLARVAQAVGRLNPGGVAIDIGANIGDSLAVIARHSPMQVLCIDASDFFTGYLKQNVERFFQGRASVLQAFVTRREGEAPTGLVHWGGTAKPDGSPFAESCGAIGVRTLIARAGDVALLKIDTDGYDLDIIEGVFDPAPDGTREARRFPIYFELEITDDKAEAARAAAARAAAFFEVMRSVGYANAFVWDDPGRFFGVLDLDDRAQVRDAINYMTHLRHRPVWGFNICLIGRDDNDLARTLAGLVSNDVMLPVGD
jgi:FkbM family methyltransferase